MDEVDSIGSARTENSGGGGDSEVQRTMLELLNQLDGFEASNKIKVRVHNIIRVWLSVKLLVVPLGCFALMSSSHTAL
jgi:SpoVK/Ycf46/Vps4 family AAA+-type ATPase